MSFPAAAPPEPALPADADPAVPAGPRDHNAWYHRIVFDALPTPCDRVLDVGCGTGMLTRRLRAVAAHVVGVDRDRGSIEFARSHEGARDIEYLEADLLDAPLDPGSFDAVVAVASLHHMDARRGLERMIELVEPGGALVVIGLARSTSASDFAMDALGVFEGWASRVSFARRRTSARQLQYEYTAPLVWPPPVSYGDMRRIARDLLPGSTFRRHPLYRYSIVWRKPS